jgi:hypothetical protein
MHDTLTSFLREKAQKSYLDTRFSSTFKSFRLCPIHVSILGPHICEVKTKEICCPFLFFVSQTCNGAAGKGDYNNLL